MTDFMELRKLGDASMRSGSYQTAKDQYCAAWDLYAEQRKTYAEAGKVREFDERHTAQDAFWLLMSGANAQFGAGDFEGCLDTCMTAFDLFKELGYVVGNPFFHLRVGQASFELDAPGDDNGREMTIDNLARALICGGIEIFSGEAPEYLDTVLEVLRPPEGYSSWHDARGYGASVDKLNGATGFLAETFAAKYGAPPPYPEG